MDIPNRSTLLALVREFANERDIRFRPVPNQPNVWGITWAPACGLDTSGPMRAFRDRAMQCAGIDEIVLDATEDNPVLRIYGPAERDARSALEKPLWHPNPVVSGDGYTLVPLSIEDRGVPSTPPRTLPDPDDVEKPVSIEGALTLGSFRQPSACASSPELKSVAVARVIDRVCEPESSGPPVADRESIHAISERLQLSIKRLCIDHLSVQHHRKSPEEQSPPLSIKGLCIRNAKIKHAFIDTINEGDIRGPGIDPPCKPETDSGAADADNYAFHVKADSIITGIVTARKLSIEDCKAVTNAVGMPKTIPSEDLD